MPKVQLQDIFWGSFSCWRMLLHVDHKGPGHQRLSYQLLTTVITELQLLFKMSFSKITKPNITLTHNIFSMCMWGSTYQPKTFITNKHFNSRCKRPLCNTDIATIYHHVHDRTCGLSLHLLSHDTCHECLSIKHAFAFQCCTPLPGGT